VLSGFVCLSVAARAAGTVTAQLPGPEDEVAWQSPPGAFAMVNEVIWNRLTADGVTAPPPPGLALNN